MINVNLSDAGKQNFKEIVNALGEERVNKLIGVYQGMLLNLMQVAYARSIVDMGGVSRVPAERLLNTEQFLIEVTRAAEPHLDAVLSGVRDILYMKDTEVDSKDTYRRIKWAITTSVASAALSASRRLHCLPKVEMTIGATL